MRSALRDTLDCRVAETLRTFDEPVSLGELKKLVNGMGAELKALLSQHAAIGKRLSTLRQTIAGLSDLFGPAGDKDLRDPVTDFQRKAARRNTV